MATLLVTPDGIPVVTVTRRIQRLCGCGRFYWGLGKPWIAPAETCCPDCLMGVLEHERDDLDHLVLVYRRFRGEPPHP